MVALSTEIVFAHSTDGGEVLSLVMINDSDFAGHLSSTEVRSSSCWLSMSVPLALGMIQWD
jgi:hypothetical protein